MKNILNTAFVLAVMMMAVACKKDEVTPVTDNPTPSTMGSVNVELEHLIHDLPMVLNQQYILNNGDTMSFSTFRYYVSNIQLVKADGSMWSEPNSYHVVDLSD